MLNSININNIHNEIVFSIRHDGEDCGGEIDMYHVYGHPRHKITASKCGQIHNQTSRFHKLARHEVYTYD